MDMRLVVFLCVALGTVPLDAEQRWRALLAEAEQLKSETRFLEAERTFWSAVDEARRLEPDPLPAAAAYHELGGLYQDTGQCAAASRVYQRSVELLEKAGDRGEIYFLRAANHLVGLDLECGAVAAAERHNRDLVAPRLAKPAARNRPPDIAQALTNLGSIDYQRRRYSAARGHYEEALAIRERLSATPPADMAILWTNLAHALLRTGAFDRALEASRRAVEVAESDAATPAPVLAALLVNAAEIHAGAGHWPDVEPWIARALTLSRGPAGQDQPLTAAVMARHAALLKKHHRKREAAALESRAREIQLQFPGAAAQRTVDVRELSILK